MRRGFSLVEALLAMALLGVLIAGCLYVMVGAARTAKRSGDLLAEGILAQLAVRRVRDAVMTNPKYLENLESKYGFRKLDDGRVQSLGLAVPRASPAATPEGPVSQSLLLADALGSALSLTGPSDATLLTATERAGVLESLSDLVVRITLSDGARPLTFAGRSFNQGALKELVKQVDVEVYWLSGIDGGQWTPAYTMQDQILTPVESLSNEALAELQAAFDRKELGSSIAEIRTQLAGKESFQRYDEDTREIAARVFYIYREANVEAFLTQGSAVSVKAKGNTAPLDQQIRELFPQKAPYLRKRLASAYVKKAQTIFDAFRKVNLALSELAQRHQKFEADVRVSRTTLKELLAKAKGLSRDVQKAGSAGRLIALGDEAVEAARGYQAWMGQSNLLVKKALLFEYLVNDPRTAMALNRLAHYPFRFADALRRAAGVYAEIAGNSEASWLARADATTQWVEVTTALSLMSDPAATAGIPTHLASLTAQWRLGIPYLADYLEQTDLARAALPVLSARNPGFAAALPAFESLAKRTSPVLAIAGRYLPTGAMTGYLDDAGRVGVYLYTAAVGTGRGAARVGMSAAQARAAIEKVRNALPEPLEQSVRLGLCSVAELAAPRLPGQATRVARSRGASAISSGGKGPAPEGLAPKTTPAASGASFSPGASPSPGVSPSPAASPEASPSGAAPAPAEDDPMRSPDARKEEDL